MYEELANAIIIQAARDFILAYRRLKSFPNDRQAQNMVDEITRFFCSGYFRRISDADGPTILLGIMERTDGKRGDAG